jgi:hypothetical protein
VRIVMRRVLLNFHFMLLSMAAAGPVLLVASCLAQQQHQPSATQDSSLKKFLQGYIGVPTDENKTTRYSAAFVDLRDDGTQEVIVYLTSKVWCGTGGCTMLVLAPDGPTYRIVTRITVTRPPIRILDAKSNGWHDIGVQVRGGGAQPGYEAELPFDGKTYPRNPSMLPARRAVKNAAGEVVVPYTAEGTPLY